MGTFEEWTFEAGPEPTVGAGGIRTRYPTGAYDSMRTEWTETVNLSGTAIMKHYRLKQNA